MSTLKPLFDFARTAVRSVVSEAALALAPHDRWTILPIDSATPAPANHVHGLVVGRRLVPYVGVVGFLALQPDGTLKPALLPVEGHVPEYTERDVRVHFVRSSRRVIQQRGHDFVPSPVLPTPTGLPGSDDWYPELCAVCAEEPYVHEQDHLQVILEEALGTLDVRVAFRGNTARIESVMTRDPAPPRDPPRMVYVADESVPGGRLVNVEPPSPAPRAWRPLTQAEWHKVLRACPQAARWVSEPEVPGGEVREGSS